MNDVKKMVWGAAKHAALERLSVLQAQQSADAKNEFQQAADFVRLSGEMSESCSAHLRWMAWNAAWHAANALAGNHAQARQDRGRFDRHARALRGGLLRGVNLGGWLLLERWMNAAAFAGTTEAEAPDEYSLCTHLEAAAPGRAAERIGAWRREWMTLADFKAIRALGFNCVRVPFGWWVVEGVEVRPPPPPPPRARARASADNAQRARRQPPAGACEAAPAGGRRSGWSAGRWSGPRCSTSTTRWRGRCPPPPPPPPPPPVLTGQVSSLPSY